MSTHQDNKPVCQWATCPRHKEICPSQSWVGFQYECLYRIYDGKTYRCHYNSKEAA